LRDFLFYLQGKSQTGSFKVLCFVQISLFV